HLRHAAAGMPRFEIAFEERVLLGGGAWRPDLPVNVGIALEDPAEAGRWRKIGGDDPHRLAGVAAFAGRPVDEVLAAPEAVVGQQCMQRTSPAPRKMGEELPLLSPRQIGARHSRSQKKLGILGRMVRHLRALWQSPANLRAKA